MAIRTISAAGGIWYNQSTWDEGIIPLSSDDIVARADGTSGNLDLGSFTLSCGSLNFTNYYGLLSSSGTYMDVYGSIVFSNTMTVSLATWQIYARGSGVISLYDKVIMNIAIYSGTYTLQSSSANTALQVINGGTLNCNGYPTGNLYLSSGTINCQNMNIGSLTISGINTVCNCSGSTVTALSLTSGLINADSNFYATLTNTTCSPNSGSNLGNLTIKPSVTSLNLNLSGVQLNNFTYIPTTTSSISLTGNLTVNGLLTLKGNATAYANRMQVVSSIVGTQITITAGSVDMAYLDLCDVAANNWDLSTIPGGSGDRCGNSGITFTPSTTQTLKGADLLTVANWTTRVPLPQDDVILTNSSFSGTLTSNIFACRNFDCSGFTGTFPAGLSWSLYGNFSKGNCTYGSMFIIFKGRNTQTVTSNGYTAPIATQILNLAIVSVLDNLNTALCTISGKLSLNGFPATTSQCLINQTGLLDIRNSPLTCTILTNNYVGTLLADGSIVNISANSTVCVFTDPLHILNITIGASNRNFTFNDCHINKLQIGQSTSNGRILTISGIINIYEAFKLMGTSATFSLSGTSTMINKSGAPLSMPYTIPGNSSFAIALYGPPIYLLRANNFKFTPTYANQRALKYGPRNERRESYRRMRGNPCQR